VCAGTEIDSVYADVTLARWERFSGQKAARIDGPITADQRARETSRGGQW